MKLIEHMFEVEGRSSLARLYVIGDSHVGAQNCAEDKIKRLVARIADDPNAYWFGGGDLVDAVILNDAKRFDPTVIPDWMLSGSPEDNRDRLQDILQAQGDRFLSFVQPIKHKCLGLIEGNHEYTIMKYHNRNFMQYMCDKLETDNLTDCAFVRLKFARKNGATSTIRVFITHGHGGGRTSGAEPNILYRLAADKECDIVFKGHSHTFCIHPPIPMLSIPARGELPRDPTVYDKHAANWGAFIYTYASGSSTYASRANYPVRPLYTVEAEIRPFAQDHHKNECPSINMTAVKL